MSGSADRRVDGDDGPRSRPGDPRRWKVLGVCLVSGFMTLLDVSIVNVALPSIQHGVGTSASQLQWVLTGYAVTFGLVLVPAGRLGDSYGRKRLFLTGLVVFLLGSLACGLAQEPAMLVAGRVVQGAGAGVLNPQITALISSEFTGAERSRAFGLFGGTVGLSTAVGPLAGGLIIGDLPLPSPWRYIFLVNLPIGAAAFVLGLRLMPARPSGRRQRLDGVGTLLLAVAVVALLLPIQERGGLGTALTVGSLGLAVVAGIMFAVHERRHEAAGHQPLVRPSLFRVPSFTPGILVGTLYFAGFTSIFFCLTLYLQQSLHYSPLQAGASQMPFALSSAVSAPLSSRRVRAMGRRLVVRGLVTVTVGLAGVLAVVAVVAPALGRSWTGLLLVVPLAVTGAGSGQVISPNLNLSLARVPRADAGSGSGVFQTLQRLGSGLGLAVVGAVFLSFAGRGDYQRAIEASLALTTALIALALVPAVTDVVRHRHDGERDGEHELEPEGEVAPDRPPTSPRSRSEGDHGWTQAHTGAPVTQRPTVTSTKEPR